MTWWGEDQHSTSDNVQFKTHGPDPQLFSICVLFSFYPPETSHDLLFPRLWFRKDWTHTRWYVWEQSCGQWKAPSCPGAPQDPDLDCILVYLGRCTAQPLAPRSNSVGCLGGCVHLSRELKRKAVLLLIYVLFWVLVWLDIGKKKTKQKQLEALDGYKSRLVHWL